MEPTSRRLAADSTCGNLLGTEAARRLRDDSHASCSPQASRTPFSAGFLARRLQHLLPIVSPSPAMAEWHFETDFLVTVAGPRWNYTSFPIQPLRAPENIRELTQRGECVKCGSRRGPRRALQPTRRWRRPGTARVGRRNRLPLADQKNHLSMYR